jgi:hypothetical protein
MLGQKSYEPLKNEQEVLLALITDPIDVNDKIFCQRCETGNCISVKFWWGTGAYDKETYYSKVTNNTDTTVTYKLCVLQKDGHWDCGTDQVKPYATSSTIYYANASNKGESIYYAAFGDVVHQECNFPNP